MKNVERKNFNSKKLALFPAFLFMLFSFKAFAEIPSELQGIWESEDRILFLGNDDEISIILKVFDRWYFDRAGESEDFEEKSTRDRNSATSRYPVILSADFEKTSENSSCYEMTIYDGGTKLSTIPLAVLNNQIFLDFLMKIPEIDPRDYNSDEIKINGATDSSKMNSIYGYWQGINSKENIRICVQKGKENIYSYFILPHTVYRLRFWETDMEYDGDAKAAFTDGENIFTVSKHIFTGGKNFSCTSGRSKRIRNVNKFQNLPFDASMSDDEMVLALGKADFTKADAGSKERLLEIVKEANSRRKPLPPLPFSEEDIDFHWDLIDELEKDNPIIQKVRERQKDFGERGKDRGK